MVAEVFLPLECVFLGSVRVTIGPSIRPRDGLRTFRLHPKVSRSDRDDSVLDVIFKARVDPLLQTTWAGYTVVVRGRISGFSSSSGLVFNS